MESSEHEADDVKIEEQPPAATEATLTLGDKIFIAIVLAVLAGVYGLGAYRLGHSFGEDAMSSVVDGAARTNANMKSSLKDALDQRDSCQANLDVTRSYAVDLQRTQREIDAHADAAIRARLRLAMLAGWQMRNIGMAEPRWVESDVASR